MRYKQWSVYAGWKNAELKVPEGIVQFVWIDGKGKDGNRYCGWQRDFTADGVTRTGEFHVTFERTETFDGFVKWAMGCVRDMDGTFLMLPGCPECGTIYNADTAECLGQFHVANQNSTAHLHDFMQETFPRALFMENGDAAASALRVLAMSAHMTRALLPILSNHFQAVMQGLEATGVDIPKELLKR